MKLLIINLLIICSLFSYVEKLLVLDKQGSLKYTTNDLSSSKNLKNIKIWNNAETITYFQNNTTIKVGVNSRIVILLGETAKIYLDQKSVVNISFEIIEDYYRYTCVIIEGRISMEIPEKDKMADFYISTGPITTKAFDGKVCIEYDPKLRTKQIIQIEGKSTIFPPPTTRKREKPKFNFFSLTENQKAVFKDFRYIHDKFYFIDTRDWRFAFSPQRNKTDGMLDVKEKWQ